MPSPIIVGDQTYQVTSIEKKEEYIQPLDLAELLKIRSEHMVELFGD